MSNWISVDERMPDENREVFVGCFTKQGVAVFYAVAMWRKTPWGSFAWEDEDCVIHHPTHWMPLPEPPPQ
jgi:hypothetical protein